MLECWSEKRSNVLEFEVRRNRVSEPKENGILSTPFDFPHDRLHGIVSITSKRFDHGVLNFFFLTSTLR